MKAELDPMATPLDAWLKAPINLAVCVSSVYDGETKAEDLNDKGWSKRMREGSCNEKQMC